MYADYGRGAARLETPRQLVLEIDADVEAALLTLGMIMNDTDIESDDLPYVGKYERVKIFAFMLLAVFGAIAHRSARRGTGAARSHPPARVRLSQLYRYLLDFASHNEALDAAIKDGVRLAHLQSQYSTEDYLSSVLEFGDEDINESLRLDAMRKDIQNAYDSYKFGNLRVLVRGLLDDMGFREKFYFSPD